MVLLTVQITPISTTPLRFKAPPCLRLVVATVMGSKASRQCPSRPRASFYWLALRARFYVVATRSKSDL